MRRGVAVSPGIAVGRAYCVDALLGRRRPQRLEASALSAEVERFDRACIEAGRELDAIVDRVSEQIGEQEAGIFRGHRMLLRDPALIGKVTTTILKRQVDAHTALHHVLDEYTALFARISDEYIKERMADLRDVAGRILAQLALGN